MGADTKVNTRGGGALQMGDLRLLEDGGERGGAFVSHTVAPETAVGDQACQGALTRKQTLRGGGAPERGHGAPLEPLAELGDALGGVGAAALMIEAAELVGIQAAKGRRSVNGR